MTESIERYAKLLALFSALCLVEGVLFNIFFFLAFEVSGFSLLTVGDYLSTSAAHLPLVAIVGVASLVNAMLINRRGWVFRGMGVVAKNRRWLGAACIVAGSMSLVSAAMGVKRDAGNWAMISGGVGVVWILMTVAPRVEIETRRFAAALAMFALLTVVLCAQGFKRGAAIADSEQPVAILFTDNQREYRGALVGVFRPRNGVPDEAGEPANRADEQVDRECRGVPQAARRADRMASVEARQSVLYQSLPHAAAPVGTRHSRRRVLRSILASDSNRPCESSSRCLST